MEVKTNSLKAWLLAARPKTLTGAAVPVMIGGAWSWVDAQMYEDTPLNWIPLVLCFLFAFIMQINANFINDFFDFVNGADDSETRLGPRRACAQGWITLDAMKRGISACTCLAIVVGLPLIWYGGLEMVLVGLFCVVFCFLYTTHLSYLGMGDVLVLLFFVWIVKQLTGVDMRELVMPRPQRRRPYQAAEDEEAEQRSSI